MKNQIWKELQVTPEEEKLAQEIRDGGVGNRLSPEQMAEFQVREETDVEIDTRVGKTLVHLYFPEESEGPLPLFVNIHGGGFIKGRRDQDIVFCRNFCSQAGVIIADIDYVPAPVMRYPGQVYACYDVFQYFAAHASEWNVDLARIALGGHSAGGNLTAAIVLMAIHENGAIPALQILDYAGFDMKTPAIEKRNGNSNPRIPAWKADFYNKMYVNPEDTEEIYCSPGLASDEDLAKMPPTIMIYCENDTFCDEAAEFHNRLLHQGGSGIWKTLSAQQPWICGAAEGGISGSGTHDTDRTQAYDVGYLYSGTGLRRLYGSSENRYRLSLAQSFEKKGWVA